MLDDFDKIILGIVSESPFSLLLVVLLIAVNGFFAGAEVSLLSVRHSRLRQMAEEGVAGAQAALNLLSNPGRLLSVTQVGVTLASLGLGWAGEDAIFQILVRLFQPMATPVTQKFFHGFSLVVAFLVISYCHVVIGEVVPKNLAIEKADRLAVLVAPALLVFYRISIAFVVVVERSAAVLTRLLRLKGGAHSGGHSAECPIERAALGRDVLRGIPGRLTACERRQNDDDDPCSQRAQDTSRHLHRPPPPSIIPTQGQSTVQPS